MKKAYDVNTGIATFTFDGLESVVFSVSKMSAENEQAMLGHGVLARIGDCAALSRKQADGSVRTITEQMRRDEILAAVQHYESGTTAWEMRSAQRAPAQNPLWAAIAAKRNVAYDVIAKEYADKAMAELAELG